MSENEGWNPDSRDDPRSGGRPPAPRGPARQGPERRPWPYEGYDPAEPDPRDRPRGQQPPPRPQQRPQGYAPEPGPVWEDPRAGRPDYGPAPGQRRALPPGAPVPPRMPGPGGPGPQGAPPSRRRLPPNPDETYDAPYPYGERPQGPPQPIPPRRQGPGPGPRPEGDYGPGPDYGPEPPRPGRQRSEPRPDGHVNDDIDLDEVDPKGVAVSRAKEQARQGDAAGGKTSVIGLCAVGVLLLVVAAYSAHSGSTPPAASAGAASTPSPSSAPQTSAAATATSAPAGAGASASAVASSSPPASASPSSTSTVAVNIAAVHVAVFNGSGVSQRAANIKSALVTDGFTMASFGGNATKTTTTKIYYPQGRSDSAAAVAHALAVPSANVVQSTAYTEVTLIIGTDWPSGNTYPAGASASATP